MPKQEEQPKEPSPITSSAYTIPESTRGVWNNTQKESKVDWLQQNSRPASSNLSWSQPTSSSFNTFQQAPHTQNPLASTIFSQPPQQQPQPVINQQRSIFDMQNQQMQQLQQEHIMKQQLLQAQMMQQGISQQQMTNLMNNLNLSKEANIFGSNFGVIGQHQIQQVSLQQQRQAQFLQMQQIQQMQQRQMLQQQQMNRITPTTSHFEGYKNLQTPQSLSKLNFFLVKDIPNLTILVSNSNHRLDMISHSPSLQKWPVISNLENDPDRASLQTPSDNAPNHSKQPSNVSNHSDKRRSKSRKTTPPANLSGWGEIPEFENQTDHKLGTSYWGNEEPAPQAHNKPTKNIENDAKKVLSGSLNWLENSNKSETTEKPPVINVWQQNIERRAKELEENAKKSENKSEYRPEKRFERRGRYVDREKIEIKPENKRDDRRDREKRFDKNRGDRKKRDDRRRDENRDNRKKNHSGRQKESDKPKIIKSEGWGDVDGTQEQPASNWMKEVQKLPNNPVTTGKSKPIEINAKKWDDVKVEKKRVRSGKDNRDNDEKKISSDKFSDKNYAENQSKRLIFPNNSKTNMIFDHDVYEPEKPEKGRSRFRSGDKNVRRDRNFGARNDDKPRRGGFRRNRDSNQKDQQHDRSQRGSENTKNFKNNKSSFHSRKNDERRDDNRDQLPEKKKADQKATKKPPSQTLRDVANNNKQATTSLL